MVQTTRIEHEKHDHRVGGRVFPRVQFLHLLHGFQSCGGSSIVKAQHIGRDVHENGSHDRMVLRNVREEFGEDWTENARQYIDRSGSLAYLHDAKP